MVIFMSLFGWLFRWNMWIITKNGCLNVLGINMMCPFIHHIPLCYVLCFLWGTFVHFEWSKCLVYHTSLHMSIRRCSASWCIQNRLTGIFISLNNKTSRKYHIPKKNIRIGLELYGLRMMKLYLEICQSQNLFPNLDLLWSIKIF